MARPIRLDMPNSFYHVLSRGNERREIFFDEKDYNKFLEIIGRTVERFKIEVHAYVLMPNHFHLLLRTKEANLSKAIQWLGVSYSVWFNKKHKRSGHLFQGRFKSFLVENEKYFAAMCFYIHGNPYRARIVDNLAQYRWSSYNGYVIEKYQEPWLITDLFLSMYGGNRNKFRREQEAYLNQSSQILKDLYYGVYLGTREFAKQCLKLLKETRHTEKPQIKGMLKGQDIEDIASRILIALGENRPDLVFCSAKKKNKPNRDITIHLLNNLGIFTNKEIGEIFKIGYTAVTEAAKRGASLIENKKELREKVNNITIDI